MDLVEKVKSTLSTYGDSDVRNLLHKDHLRIRELSKELAETESAARRKTVLREFKPFLTSHARAEESVVYKRLMAVRDSEDSRDAGNEGMVEHNLADILLERVGQSSDTKSDIWKARAKVLHEMLGHHISEEKNLVFEELGEHFEDAERDRMGAEFASAKEAILKPAARHPGAGPRRSVGTTRRSASAASRKNASATAR